MKALPFLTWLRDEVHCIPQSKEGSRLGLPSNGELRRWMQKGSVLVNDVTLSAEHLVQWPITSLVFFPKNVIQRVTII